MLTVNVLNKTEAHVNAHATYEAPLSPLSIASKLDIPMTDVAAALRDLAADKVLNVRSMGGQPCYFPRRQELPVQDDVPKPEDYAKADEDPDEEKDSKDDSKEEEDDEEKDDDLGCKHCGKVLATWGRTRQHEVLCGKNPDRPKPKVSEKKVRSGPIPGRTVPKERAVRVPHSTYFDDVGRMYAEGKSYEDMTAELGTTEAVVDNVIHKMLVKGLLERRDRRGVRLTPEEKREREATILEMRRQERTNAEIAQEFGIDVGNVEHQVAELHQSGVLGKRINGRARANKAVDAKTACDASVPVSKPEPVRANVSAGRDPLEGLGSLIAELQRIPGVKVQISISIGLGVGQ